MSDSNNSGNPLGTAIQEAPVAAAKKRLEELSADWRENRIEPWPVPLFSPELVESGSRPFSEPEWINGWRAFEIMRLQTEPYQWAPVIARICAVISDQIDRDERGLNFAMQKLPPTHELLNGFVLGSNQWFRALYTLLKISEASKIKGWDDLVSRLYDWIGPFSDLRIRTSDLLDNALHVAWPYQEYSLPEAKQDPIWSFPKAMTWIATRDYLAMARMGVFRQASDPEEAVAVNGVCRYNTEALGWLHTLLSFTRCKCGAFGAHSLEVLENCTCISVAWEELVHFSGGLTKSTPELVFDLQEGWLSMTWPEGADDIRFLRRDILEQWPADTVEETDHSNGHYSSSNAENQCREWLEREFEIDTKKQRTKSDFRKAALAAFAGRLSARGFNLRVWPILATKYGRDSAGAKKKS